MNVIAILKLNFGKLALAVANQRFACRFDFCTELLNYIELAVAQFFVP